MGALNNFENTRFVTKQIETTVKSEKNKNNGGKRAPIKDTIKAQIIRSISP